MSVDLAGTRRRAAALERYVSGHLLRDDIFQCPHATVCGASLRPNWIFREGIMSHVGNRFDMRLGDRPLRVVVVGQESGWIKNTDGNQTGERVTLTQRRADIAVGSGRSRRYYAGDGYPGRNPHMRGTTSALRVIFGGSPGADFDGEWVQPVTGRAFHLFDGFALVNLLLCSASKGEGSAGASTLVMRRNCVEHFASTLEILQPTLVVTQGAIPAGGIVRVLPPRRTLGAHLFESRQLGERVLVATFSHPSARADARWGDRLDRPYLTNVVEPTLRRAMSHP